MRGAENTGIPNQPGNITAKFPSERTNPFSSPGTGSIPALHFRTLAQTPIEAQFNECSAEIPEIPVNHCCLGVDKMHLLG